MTLDLFMHYDIEGGTHWLILPTNALTAIFCGSLQLQVFYNNNRFLL